MAKDIYDKRIWNRMLSKNPDLMDYATKCGVSKEPEKAKQIREKYRRNFGTKELNPFERRLAAILCTVEFQEMYFLNQVVMTGKVHQQAGATDYVISAFDLVLEDFNDSFRDWLIEVRTRNIPEDAPFEQMYEVFLDVIELKESYKEPYTKMFIKKLLQTSSNQSADRKEIRDYFLATDQRLLYKMKDEIFEQSCV